VLLSLLELNININTVPMVKETNANQANSHGSAPPFPPLPTLSPQLNVLYNSLNDDMRRIFVKIYSYLWGVVNDQGCSGVVSKWWVLRLVAESAGLPPSSFAVLSYLYMTTNKGRKLIRSKYIYLAGVLPGAVPKTVQRVVWDLKHAGLITRHTRNPDEPYLQRSHSRQPVFLKLTYKGVALIEGIEQDLNKLLLNTSFNDLTGCYG